MFLHSALLILDRFFPTKVAHAHCDIPCGIYDPYHAQLAAHTVLRMDKLIADESAKMAAIANPTTEERKEFVHKIARYTATKDQHAELAKAEVRIIWGDYFKPEHTEKFPELHSLVWKIMKAGSKGRQETSMAAAEELLENVNKFAEIFWKTKGIETMRVKAPYPTEKELVFPKLK